MIAILDIDGVLADATHRQHFVSGRPKDWNAFFAAVGQDPVLPEGRRRLRELAEDHEVVLLSGRPESTRQDTLAWLARHDIAVDGLVLRADRDYRPAATLKAEMITQIGGPDAVAVVVDDDPSVVERLGELGYRAELFG